MDPLTSVETVAPPEILAENLISKSVEASISGVANVSLSVVELLDVHVSGSARVRYVGSPYVSQKVSGSGSVKRDPGHSI